MSNRDDSISSTRLSSHEASCTALRTSPKTQAEREDNVETPVQELRVAVHKASGNRYGTTKISSNASAVLGDVTHHNYFYGGKVPYLPGLQVYREGVPVDPDTISDYDFNYAHWLRSEQRLEYTCEWVFERTAYRRWINNTGPPILIVSGTVGSGKSVTASAVIDKLSSQSDKVQLVISYFVDHSRDQPTTCIEILRALVKQILRSQKFSNEVISEGLQSSVKAIFPSTQARPSAKAITSLLSQCMLELNSCVLVLDGIDALPEREIDEFLDFVHGLFPLTKNKHFSHKLVVFCRHSLGRGIRLESIPSSALCEIRLEDIQRDLFTFVEHEVDSRQRRRAITDDVHLIEETKNVLKTHCGKMFLWIRLQTLGLWDPGMIKCDDDIRRQLSSLPEGLDEIYTRCLRRIEDTYSKNSREIAPKLFKWVACANEPLTQLQAREAASITPTNIPLRKSQLLNTPAEDHCANLVTLDEISRKVVFPHPSVKDFLRDPLKVPPDLHHYLLSAEADEMWCGQICLAYANYLYARKQIVPYTTARVQKTIPTLLIKDVPGAWLLSRFRKSRPEQAFYMPLPVSTHRAEDLHELSLHDYMRRHWLSHNRRIKPTSPDYAIFTKLCASQDSELQPWATESVTELERFQKLFEFAVMTNHAPLFSVGENHFRGSTNDLVPQVFRTNCPGTDSSWLHVCATLGHWEVTQLVLRHCPKTIIAHGKSAAVLALEHKNFDLFVPLVPNVLPGPVWTLFSDGELKTYQENLLRACAMHGNETVINALLGRLPQSLSLEHLSDALLHACKYNSQEVCGKLVSVGAFGQYFRLLEQDGEYYESQFSLTSLVVPSLVIAWHLGGCKLWNIIRTARLKADRKYFRVGNCLDRLLQITHGSETMNGVSVFRSLEILLQYSAVEYGSRWLGGAPTWLEIIMLHVVEATVCSPVYAWNSISRKLLRVVDVSYMFRQVPTAVSHGEEHPILRWLEQVSDDILVHVLKNDLIQMRLLLDPALILKLGQRWTSRGLEAWLVSLHIEQTLCKTQSNDTASRLCLSAALEQCVKNHASYISEWWWVDYRAPLSTLKAQSNIKGRDQIMDFLACYEFANEPGVTFGKGGRKLQDMLSVWDVSTLNGSGSEFPRSESEIPLPSTLTWLRLYSVDGGNTADTEKMWNDWSLRGIDGNFALNYPAGYDSSGHDIAGFHNLNLRGGIGQLVQRCIVEAVYRWNFRLRRKHRAIFSDAEMWYMAYVLKRVAKNWTHFTTKLQFLNNEYQIWNA